MVASMADCMSPNPGSACRLVPHGFTAVQLSLAGASAAKLVRTSECPRRTGCRRRCWAAWAAVPSSLSLPPSASAPKHHSACFEAPGTCMACSQLHTSYFQQHHRRAVTHGGACLHKVGRHHILRQSVYKLHAETKHAAWAHQGWSFPTALGVRLLFPHITALQLQPDVVASARTMHCTTTDKHDPRELTSMVWRASCMRRQLGQVYRGFEAPPRRSAARTASRSQRSCTQNVQDVQGTRLWSAGPQACQTRPLAFVANLMSGPKPCLQE